MPIETTGNALHSYSFSLDGGEKRLTPSERLASFMEFVMNRVPRYLSSRNHSVTVSADGTTITMNGPLSQEEKDHLSKFAYRVENGKEYIIDVIIKPRDGSNP